MTDAAYADTAGEGAPPGTSVGPQLLHRPRKQLKRILQDCYEITRPHQHNYLCADYHRAMRVARPGFKMLHPGRQLNKTLYDIFLYRW